MARRHLPALYVLTRVAFLFISSTIFILVTLLNSRNSFDDDDSVLHGNHRIVKKFKSSISIDEVIILKNDKFFNVNKNFILEEKGAKNCENDSVLD